MVEPPIGWPFVRLRTTVLLCIASVFLASACDPMAPGEGYDDDLRSRFDLQTLGPIPYPSNNLPNQNRIELGRKLFFDPILGGEKDVSCGACHHPKFGFSDDRQFGAGVSGDGLGPNRVLSTSALTGNEIHPEPRNSQTIFNVAFNGDQNGEPSAKGFQFWDGRARGLEAQATLPIASRDEMRGDAYTEANALDSVLARLRGIPEYRKLFARAFPREAAGPPPRTIIDSANYGRALAAYQRELVTRNSAYDKYVRGNPNALTFQQKKGLELFFTKGECATCHSGPMFSDFDFVVHGTPQEGVGKKVIPGDDTGREEATKNPADRYKFRTPSLRNVEITPPYMHAGVFETLEEVVRFYSRGARPRHEEVADEDLDPSLHEPRNFTEEEIDALVAFLRSLTDPGRNLPRDLVTVPAHVPSGLPPVTGIDLEE